MRVPHGDPARLAAPRPAPSAEFLELVADRYGLCVDMPQDLGGSLNPNLLVDGHVLRLPLRCLLEAGARPADVHGLADAYDAGCATPLSGDERRALPFAMARMALSFLQYLALPGDAAYLQRLRREFNEKRGPACQWWLNALRDGTLWERVFA